MSYKTVYPASAKQVQFLTNLGYRGNVNLSSREASDLINEALELGMDTPRAPRPSIGAAVVANPVVEPGMYRLGEAIFKVQRSKTSQKLYALELTRIGGQRLAQDGSTVKWEFQYAPGAIVRLSATDKLSIEDAKKFGIETGVCCVCGAFLSDAKSVAAGIGPTCAKRFSKGA